VICIPFFGRRPLLRVAQTSASLRVHNLRFLVFPISFPFNGERNGKRTPPAAAMRAGLSVLIFWNEALAMPALTLIGS
jgi:hypothetical protein